MEGTEEEKKTVQEASGVHACVLACAKMMCKKICAEKKIIVTGQHISHSDETCPCFFSAGHNVQPGGYRLPTACWSCTILAEIWWSGFFLLFGW